MKLDSSPRPGPAARLSLLALAAANPLPALADDWPQYLGPARDGVWREDGIVEQFPEGGPPLRWRADLGAGFSGPAVAGGRVFVMDRQAEPIPADRRDTWKRMEVPGNERVVCLREADGEQLWVFAYDCPYTTATEYATGPRATPTVDPGGELVFCLGAEGHLHALRTGDGSLAWARDFKEDFGLKVPVWGLASHPLVVGDLLICMAGGKGASVVALDKRTGEERWRALDSSQPGYAPPMLYRVGDEDHLFVWNSDTAAGLDPSSGEVYWSIPFKAQYAMAIGAPRLEGRKAFLSSYRRKSAMFEIAPSGRAATIAWRGNSKVGLGSVLSTPALEDGLIYGCGQDGRFSCVRLEDGKRLWTTFEPFRSDRPVTWGNVFIVRHGKRYWLASDLGELILAELGPSGYREVASARLIEPTTPVWKRKLVWAHPAFAHRSVYLRNDEEIRCYSLAAGTAPDERER